MLSPAAAEVSACLSCRSDERGLGCEHRAALSQEGFLLPPLLVLTCGLRCVGREGQSQCLS